MHHPIDRIAHTMACVTPVVEHWLEQEISQWVFLEVVCKFTLSGRKEGNVLFNDALNTFYLWLLGIRHGKKPLKSTAASWATLSNQQQRFFYMHHPTDRIAHTTVFVTTVMESGMRNS